MAKRSRHAPSRIGDLDAAVARIETLTIDALRAEWRTLYRSEPPQAFSRDLLARALCHRLQEQAFGGLSPQTLRLLRSLAQPGTERARIIKVGSVLVREYDGVLHEVLVVPGGFCWQGRTFDSLSTIAKRITGTSWNGPRFFGLRSKASDKNDGATDEPVKAATPRRQRGSVVSAAEQRP